MRTRSGHFSSIVSLSGAGSMALISFAIMLALLLTATKAVAGPPTQSRQAVPASGAAPSAASSQAARSAPSAAGQQSAVSNRGPAQDTAGANAGVTLVDNGRVLLGGKVFSTGTDD